MNPFSQYTDSQLVKSALEGQEDAFKEIYERYYKMAFRLSYRLLSHKEAAEDVTQEVFIKMARSLVQFREDASFKTWVTKIVVNSTRDYWRSHKNQHQSLNELDEERTEDLRSRSVDLSLQIRDLLTCLPEKTKEVLILVEVEGLSHAEAAKVVGCREITVSWHIHKAKKVILNYHGMTAVEVEWNTKIS
jgi:RNA polymerase sigma factor (sigma-70 family)